MESNMIVKVGLPIALGIVMLGLGLHLTLDDFKRVLTRPKAIFMGLGAQMLIMPAACFFIAQAFGLTPALAVGLMLLSASPGGTTANLYSHLFKGDVALNISLTAINSILAIITIPLIVNFSMEQFMGKAQYVPLQFSKVLEVVAIVLIPVSMGMLLNHKFPKISQMADKPVKAISVLVLLGLIFVVAYDERNNLINHFEQVGLPALIFCATSLLMGYWIGKLSKLTEGESRAISFEIGIHNGALAIYLALTVIGNKTMAIPAAVYSVVMFIVAFAFGGGLTKPLRRSINRHLGLPFH